MISHFGLLGADENRESEEYFRKVFHRALRKAVLTSLTWKLLAISFLIGALIVDVLFTKGIFPTLMAIVLLGGAVGLVAIFLTLKRMRTLWGTSLLLAM
ncbi:MAG: hypothetical protein KDD70_03835, partial [Bdellovibrionales bacterium]|nr:hypothetical protein [Bdellovibrionales bacterium]